MGYELEDEHGLPLRTSGTPFNRSAFCCKVSKHKIHFCGYTIYSYQTK